MAVWVAALVVPLILDAAKNGNNGNGGGPTWRWLVGVLLSIVGVGFMAWMGSVTSQLIEISHSVETLANQAGVDHNVTDYNSKQIDKLWDKVLQLDAKVKP